MAALMEYRPIVILVLNFLFLAQAAVLDITCFNRIPILDADNTEETYGSGNYAFIGGYEGTGYLTATVSFNRVVDTNTGSGLPMDSEVREGINNELDYTRLYLYDSTSDPELGSDRIGVFNCVVDNEGIVTNITTITMEKDAWIFPVTLTKTVNVGESTTLNVTATFDSSELQWRTGYPLNLLPEPSQGKPSIVFDNVTVADAGVYECHRFEVRNGSSAFMKLIVRRCPAGMWGDKCEHFCTSCYNGGICEEDTGHCICAPGFSGLHCEELRGSNRWGQQGEWQCSGSQDDHSEACKGRLMCHQDPFGCACAAGFQGLACDQLCGTSSTGKFGKNCEQTCHCASGNVGCLWDTGDCDKCENGWKGKNCQVPDPCPEGFEGDFCDRCPAAVISSLEPTPGFKQVTLQWTVDNNVCPIDYYLLQYELVKLDGCQDAYGGRSDAVIINSTSQSYNVTGLETFSTYKFYLTPHNIIGDGAEIIFDNITTNEQEPPVSPGDVMNIFQGVDTLSYSWEEIPCGNRSGIITEYQYQLLENNTGIVIQNDTVSAPTTNVTTDNLTPCTSYVFRIAATTTAGSGPYSDDVNATDITKPGPVGNLTATEVLANRIGLSWIPPSTNPCPVTAYYIEYELITKDMCQAIDNPDRVSYGMTTFTNATIQGLEPYSEYNVYVIASNEAGNGTIMSVEFVRTAESVPDEPVGGIMLLEQEINTLTFQWDEIPCGNRRGNITKYHYELYDGDEVILRDGNTTAPATQAILRNLSPCGIHMFRVAASTAEGEGPFSEYFPANTSIAVPKAVEELSISTDSVGELYVTWDTPLDDPCPTDSYFYQIQLLNLGQCNEYNPPDLIEENITNGTALLLTNLDSYSTYRIYLNGQNSAGNGTIRNATSTTQETTPESAPYKLSGIVVDSRTLSYNWNEIPCGLRGGKIVQYQYQLEDDLGFIIKNGSVMIPERSVSFNDLTPCMTYTFRVLAATSLGDGPFTDDLLNVTATEAPESVTGFTATTKGVNVINVSWQEPTNKPCPIDVYYYSYELVNLDQCELIDPPILIADGTTRDTSLSLPDLETYSTYQIYINGRNEAGDGSIQNETATTNSSTPEVAPVITSANTEDGYTLSFSWDSIPCGNRSGSISGYYYRLENEDYVAHEDVVNETTTSLTLSELIPCTQYDFTLLAINENGYGPHTETQLTTDIIAPDNVQELNVAQGSTATELDVSWRKPTTTPCPVDKYSVEYQLLITDQCDGSNLPDRQTYGEFNTTTVTLDNLIPYSGYEVFIIAKNEAGKSGATSLVQNTSEIEPSKAPGNIRNSNRTNDKLVFTWDEIECGFRGGEILRYSYQVTDDIGNLIEEGNITDYTITDVSIDGLDACVEYAFMIAGATSAGIGTFSAPVTAETDVEVPGPVQSLTATATSSPNELVITWGKQILNACPTSLYQIEYQLINQDQCEELRDPIRELDGNVTDTITTLDALLPYSTYRVYITAVNQVGSGLSATIEGTTNQTVPSASPHDVIHEATSESLTISWQQPLCGYRGGYIVSYRYNLTDFSSGITVVNDTFETSITIGSLVPCGLYQFSVDAMTIAGRGPTSEIIFMETKGVEPDEPSNLEFSEKTETTISLTWNEPADQICQVVLYKVVWKAIAKPYDEEFNGDEPSVMINTTSTFYTVEQLEPSTTYRFEVSAYNVRYPTAGPPVSIETATDPWQSLPTDEPLPEIIDKPVGKTANTITISLPTVPANYTYVNKYQIGIAPVGGSNSKRDVSTPDFGNCGDTNYIAGEVDKSVEEFTVGTGETYLNGLYCNERLNSDKTYEIYVGFASRLSDEEVGVVWLSEPIRATPVNKCSIWCWLAPVVVILILAAVIALAILYVKSRKSKSEEKMPQSNPGFDSIEIELTTTTTDAKETSTKPPIAARPKSPIKRKQTPDSATPSKYPGTGPVKIDNLSEYVYKKKANSVKWVFDDHYELLPDGQLYSCDVAQHEKNKYKNRYANIIPYDHSRVVLKKLEGDPFSDYINASYIDGFLHPNKYIATQGPNKASVPDFWRMIWQQNVRIVVMVTKCEEKEKVKCEQYWPEELKKSEMFGDIVITMVSEDVHPDFTIRKFEANKMFDNAVRTVRQYHFTSWPDMGTPDQGTPLINFIKLIKNTTEGKQQTPTVVHCSAGVGRTGTFIAIDSLLDQAKQQQKVDVFQFVVKMRENRVKMVQTIAQYDFIYDALVEEMVCGNTLHKAREFHEDYNKLKVINQKNKKNGIQEEFEKLQLMTSRPPGGGSSRGGMTPVNISKNRFPDVLPVDKSRPYLMTDGVDRSTNYINAAFLDGYDTKDKFLATQMPLPNTTGDIWRMIYDYNSYTIVMLNPMDANDKAMARYWPDEDVAYHGPLIVHFIDVTKLTHGIIYRTFKLTNKDRPNEEARIIRQYEYPSWPLNKDVPTDTKSILNLINAVDQWQTDKPNLGKPLTVHCIDGVAVSTTYCALTDIVERLKTEEVIDAFQTVKRLRMNRYGAVKSLEQYTFLYEAVAEYIDSYSIYENFSHA